MIPETQKTRNYPPFLYAVEDSTASVGLAVLPIGRATCEDCGGLSGHPDSWTEIIPHDQVVKMNTPQNVAVTVSGSFARNWERIEETEGGGPFGGCPQYWMDTTGEKQDISFNWSLNLAMRNWRCFTPLRTVSFGGNFALANPADAGAIADGELQVTDRRSDVTSLCDEDDPFCLGAGKHQNYDHDDTLDQSIFLTTNAGAGREPVEWICIDPSTGQYRYRFEWVIIAGDGDHNVWAVLYTGSTDNDRLTEWGLDDIENDFGDGYTLSEPAVAGTIRGMAIHVIYLTHDISPPEFWIYSFGERGLCPPDGFGFGESTVTGRIATGTITVAVTETGETAIPGSASNGAGGIPNGGSLTTGGLTTGSLTSGGLQTGSLRTGGLTTGSLKDTQGLQTGNIESGSLGNSGGFTDNGGLTGGSLEPSQGGL